MIKLAPDPDAVRVLIVDDNRDFADNLAELAELRGLHAQTAHDCRQALALARAAPFDVAIVDQKLPDGSGIELLADLRRLLPDLVTLVVTAFVSLDNSLAALHEGVFAFIGKDTDPDELLSTIARAAENARLRRDNRKLRRLHEATLLAIPDFLALVDESGRVQSVNQSHPALCPGEPAIAVGRPFDEMVAPFVQAHVVLGEWLVQVRRGEAPTERSLELCDGNGKRLILGLRAVALSDAQPPLLLLRAVDLTERISLERRLTETEHLATLGRLVSSIAHDLRNPLAGIRALAQLLQRSVAGPPRDVENVTEILTLADRMRATLADLLDFARPSPRAEETIRLPELLEGLVSEARLWPSADGRTIDLVTSPGAGAATLVAASDRVVGLFANLIDNALQAAPPGGRVRVLLAADGSHADVAIEDNGPGIGPEVAPHLFQPFFTTKTRGTGLGLSIVKKSVDALGGTIAADRSPDLCGTRFRARLPLAARSRNGNVTPAPAEGAP